MIVKKVYSAREYKRTAENNYRIPFKIEINNPENNPTQVQNDSKYDLVLDNTFFKNTNYPIGSTVVSVHNSCEIIINTTSYRMLTYIPKRMPFLLISQTDRVEDGSLFIL